MKDRKHIKTFENKTSELNISFSDIFSFSEFSIIIYNMK